jgi:hypothetical protein
MRVPFRLSLLLFPLGLTLGLVKVVSGVYEDESRVRCNAAYCEDNQITCTTPRNCTTVGFRTFLSPKICNCCEYCYDYLKEDGNCKTSSQNLPSDMCGPKLQCEEVNDEQKCVPSKYASTMVFINALLS